MILIEPLDNNLDVALILLDLSSVFDIVDHEILLTREAETKILVLWCSTTKD